MKTRLLRHSDDTFATTRRLALLTWLLSCVCLGDAGSAPAEIRDCTLRNRVFAPRARHSPLFESVAGHSPTWKACQDAAIQRTNSTATAAEASAAWSWVPRYNSVDSFGPEHECLVVVTNFSSTTKDGDVPRVFAEHDFTSFFDGNANDQGVVSGLASSHDCDAVKCGVPNATTGNFRISWDQVGTPTILTLACLPGYAFFYYDPAATLDDDALQNTTNISMICFADPDAPCRSDLCEQWSSEWDVYTHDVSPFASCESIQGLISDEGVPTITTAPLDASPKSLDDPKDGPWSWLVYVLIACACALAVGLAIAWYWWRHSSTPPMTISHPLALNAFNPGLDDNVVVADPTMLVNW